MTGIHGNPFINWKKLKVKYKNTEYEFLVKAIIVGNMPENIAYELKYIDKSFKIAFSDSNWIRLDKYDEFASHVGKIISEKVILNEKAIQIENYKAEKEALRKFRSEGQKWGKQFKGNKEDDH
ncbi:hypothetical protein A5893_15185 [Pedobacter psychrophilus]|uniref:Uncharacterized protein n=1 Tax=Pedobacter psychrophilus TaxID=1826909 RepID=A0A179DAR4_9SPHI|nr:hypothetical protein [Pedobacter psychrophilus]OAQ38145.1 hypothetical protein A5893_15185 [Pedobacter psychrophilus]